MAPTCDNEQRWAKVGTGLNCLCRELKPYVEAELKSFFNTLPRVKSKKQDIDNCLADKKGEVLKFDPNNEPTPQKGGTSVQLNFKSLPHHFEQTKGAKGNIPIPINNEHELSRLYLQDYYKKDKDCSIRRIDPGGLLLLIKNASCFPDDVRKHAEALHKVRNMWAHAVIEQWDESTCLDAFTKMESIARLIPNNALWFILDL